MFATGFICIRFLAFTVGSFSLPITLHPSPVLLETYIHSPPQPIMSNIEDSVELPGQSTISQRGNLSLPPCSGGGGFNGKGDASQDERRRLAMFNLHSWKLLPLNHEERLLTNNTEGCFGKNAEFADSFVKLFDDIMEGNALGEREGHEWRITQLWPLADALSFNFTTIDDSSSNVMPEYVESSISTQTEPLGQGESFGNRPVGNDAPDPNPRSTKIWDVSDFSVSQNMPCSSVTSVQPLSDLLEDERFDAICNWFRRWLDRCFQSRAPGTRTSSGTNQRESLPNSREKVQKPANLGKRGANNDELDDQDDDKGREGGGNAHPRKRYKYQVYSKKFACPFYKHDASSHPRCRLGGFPTTHRMK